MWDWILTQEQRRRRLYARLEEGPLRDYYSVPFVSKKSPVNVLEYVSIDLETTGFNAESDSILSIGRVNIIEQQIEMSTASHTLIRANAEISEQSAIIHGITDDASATGRPLREAIGELLGLLAGRVMVAHHAPLEMGFLDSVCRKLFNGPFMIPVVDTLYLAKRSMERRQHAFQANDLRLHNLRNQFGLPRYQAHNALSDALATAELLLVQIAETGNSHTLQLKDILLRKQG